MQLISNFIMFGLLQRHHQHRLQSTDLNCLLQCSSNHFNRFVLQICKVIVISVKDIPQKKETMVKIFISGAPGSGKTTLISSLCHGKTFKHYKTITARTKITTEMIQADGAGVRFLEKIFKDQCKEGKNLSCAAK